VKRSNIYLVIIYTLLLVTGFMTVLTGRIEDMFHFVGEHSFRGYLNGCMANRELNRDKCTRLALIYVEEIGLKYDPE